ncbi:unnamed protein product [Caretta caretta]
MFLFVHQAGVEGGEFRVSAAKVGSPNPPVTPAPGRTVNQHRLRKMTSFKSLMESMESLSALMKDVNIELDPKALFNAATQVYEKFMHLFKDGSPEVAALEAQEVLESSISPYYNVMAGNCIMYITVTELLVSE